MSVINKMMRDLDRRQASVDALGGLGVACPDIERGQAATLRFAPAVTARVAGWRMAVAAGLLMMVAMAASWWGLHQPRTRTDAAGVAPAPAADAAPGQAAGGRPNPAQPAASAYQLPSAMGQASQPVPVKQDAPVVPVAPAKATASINTVHTALASARPAAVEQTVARLDKPIESASQPLSGNLGLRLSSALLRLPAQARTDADDRSQLARPETPVATAPITGAGQAIQPAVKPVGTLELVAQAQALWAEGDRSAAWALLKDAMHRLEGATAGDAQDNTAVIALAREYAAAGLARGQTAEVLATLERLMPRLAGVADIWALRGNAAQRLGRHAQAVAAYQQALALYPDEPRWMLGAAVSMAALGQTDSAAEMAEKVRIARALPVDVANYLRQLGVVVRSD